jgi:TonB-linked SusC/RagA family outer membrane protein
LFFHKHLFLRTDCETVAIYYYTFLRMKHKIFTTICRMAVCLAFLLVSASAWSQRTIVGKVVDDSGDPMPGATVVLKGTTTGVITDVDGNYKLIINGNTPAGAMLLFNYTGYDPMEVSLGADNVVNVTLAVNSNLIAETVITGFGISREEKSLGYSVQKLSGEQLVRANEPNIISSLQGKVPGAFIQTASGAPGAGASIILRGISSLNPGANNQPLIVIDGIIMSNATNVGNTRPSVGSNAINDNEQYSNTNRLADLNENDVESLNILKGPAATSLYGSRGANGVIVITTKKGSAGRPRITYSTTYGFDEVNKYPSIQTTYREGNAGRLRFNADGSTLRFQEFGPRRTDEPIFRTWENFFQQGSRANHALSVAGGGKQMTYLLSVSNLNQEGIIPFSDFQRTTFRLNSEFKPTERLALGGSINYVISNNRQPNGGDKSIMSALSYHTSTFDVNDYINPLNGFQRDYSSGIIDNPRWIAEFSKYTTRVNRYTGQMYADYKLTSWMNVRYQLGVDQYTDIRNRQQPSNTDVGSQSRGFVIDENVNFREINSNLLVTMSQKFSDNLSGKLILGHSVMDVRDESNFIRGEGLNVFNFYQITNASNLFFGNSLGKNRLIGTFADASIGFKNALYLNASFRNDITSTLPKGSRSFYYPSIGLGYVFSEMFSLPKFISYGKFRASYAETGKGTDPYLIGAYYGTASNFPFNGIVGYTPSTVIGANDLRPERTKGLEAGLEMRFANNRVGFDFTWFRQRNIDQILRIPVSNTTGFSRLVGNSGEVVNEGFEVALNLTPIKSKNFTWDISASWWTFEGTVKSVAEGISEIIVQQDAAGLIVSKLVPGGKVGDLYGTPFRRDANSGQLFIDANGYPVVSSTFALAGNAMPDWQSALTNTFRYKGLSLSAQLEWKQGGDMHDLSFRNSLRNGVLASTERRYTEVIFKGVTADGSPNTRAVEIEGEGFYRLFNRYNNAAEILIQDASWLRLRNVSLSYTIPSKSFGRLPIDGLTLRVSGNNLWLNTPYAGFDPESIQFGSGSNGFGFTGLTTPAVRNFSVGLNVAFK